MNAPVVWVSDDRCPACGGPLTEAFLCTQVIQECQACGWAATWVPEPDGPDGGER